MPPRLLVPGAVRPAPGTARSWLQRELDRPDYHEGLVSRFLHWLSDLWTGLQARALDASALSTVAAVVLGVVVVVLVVLVAARTRREPRLTPGDSPVLSDPRLGADEHRAAAEAALGRGDHDLAVVEAIRAIAVRAIGRGLLEERPGLTAHELTLELAPLFPASAEALSAASLVFDRAFYGHLPATPVDARDVLDLEAALHAARPARGPAVPAGPVPR